MTYVTITSRKIIFIHISIQFLDENVERKIVHAKGAPPLVLRAHQPPTAKGDPGPTRFGDFENHFSLKKHPYIVIIPRFYIHKRVFDMLITFVSVCISFVFVTMERSTYNCPKKCFFVRKYDHR